MLSNILVTRTTGWKLVYQATRDGFSAADFHSKCDKHQNTLVIVESTNGNVFGGYTEQNWSGEGIKKIDPNSFTFSIFSQELRRRIPVFMENNNTDYAIYCSPQYGPVFGDLTDLVICSDSNNNKLSYSDMGKSFTHPKYVYGSDEAKSFMADATHFATNEIIVLTKID